MSPTEGDIFIKAHKIQSAMKSYIKKMIHSIPEEEETMEAEPTASATDIDAQVIEEPECIMCKFKVPG